jgi:hypothetical protein
MGYFSKIYTGVSNSSIAQSRIRRPKSSYHQGEDPRVAQLKTQPRIRCPIIIISPEKNITSLTIIFHLGGFSRIFRKIFHINLIKNSTFKAKIIDNPGMIVYTLPKRISYDDRS